MRGGSWLWRLRPHRALPGFIAEEPLLEACIGTVAGKKAKIKLILMTTLCERELKEFKN